MIINLLLVGIANACNLKPHFKASQRVVAQLLVFGTTIACKAREDRIAFGGHRCTTLRNHQSIGQRLRKVGEYLAHLASGFNPRFTAAFAAIVILDVFAVGYAKHCIMCIEEIRFGVKGGVGRDERQFAGIGQIDQRIFCGFFSGVAPPA